MREVYSPSAMNAAQTLRIGVGVKPLSAPYYGERIKLVSAIVTWDASVTSITHSVTLNSGLGAAYDVVLQTASVTDSKWIWMPPEDEQVIIVPSNDSLDLDVGAGGAGIRSYASMRFLVL